MKTREWSGTAELHRPQEARRVHTDASILKRDDAVDERAKAPRVCELLESLGWVPADD